jgi:kumamolisin
MTTAQGTSRASQPGRTALHGSAQPATSGTQRLRPAPPDARLDVTVLLRPRTPLPVEALEELGRMPLADRCYLSREEFLDRHGADPADIETVSEFARKAGLEITGTSAPLRHLRLAGSVADLSEAFGTTLSTFKVLGDDQQAECEFLGRSGALNVPDAVAQIIQSVHGLDERPLGRSSWRARPAGTASPSSQPARTPPAVAELYGFPTGVDGSGQRIAIIELGGGYRTSELQAFFTSLSLPMPKIASVSVNGAKNSPGVDPISDQEVMLDIEVAGSIAPGAELRIYFARMTEPEWVDAVRMAVFDEFQPDVISISWVEPESQFPRAARLAMDEAFQAAAMLGITVCCSAGDHGASDGVTGKRAHVSYPASSPWVLACGGTYLEGSADSISEVVWNDGGGGNATGGGVSEYYPAPSWQSKAQVPPSVNPPGRRGRGVPDVSANADPDSPYVVRTTAGTLVGVGGTSAVAPLWAALVALLNEHLRTKAGFMNPLLYEAIAPAGFNDVPTGNNGAYWARPDGWDACTGHGSPNGRELLAALSSAKSRTDPSARRRRAQIGARA